MRAVRDRSGLQTSRLLRYTRKPQVIMSDTCRFPLRSTKCGFNPGGAFHPKEPAGKRSLAPFDLRAQQLNPPPSGRPRLRACRAALTVLCLVLAALMSLPCPRADAKELVVNGLLRSGTGNKPQGWEQQAFFPAADAATFKWTRDPSKPGCL